MKTLEKLMSFLKAPYRSTSYNNLKAIDFFYLLLITLAVVIPYALILEWAGMDQFDHKILEILEKNKWLVAVLVIIFAPILEEPVYRLHLDLKKSSILWSLGLSLLLINSIWYPLAIFWIYLIYLYVKVNQGQSPNLKFVVYFSSAMFALVHMGNFIDFDYGKYFYVVPLLVAAQFVIGLVLSYIRLNHGMKWAIIFHAVYNAVLIIPAIYFYEP
ncbi:CPBP family glutamic-type intramembrane protease [Mongoliibacter ruber]|uniref:CAAX prenyl protease-like protein n=1 Tax=Mongoliibacter ruber TaxID=1750599 RepID=A0A2T0WMM8_9BACT|nr:CPBP family glutamic-type intramembrane protease [Mongoliibacter ruber]PRY87948.1 CAAX prenyl protease-like protein [Mongoliibacter ruber]